MDYDDDMGTDQLYSMGMDDMDVDEDTDTDDEYDEDMYLDDDIL